MANWRNTFGFNWTRWAPRAKASAASRVTVLGLNMPDGPVEHPDYRGLAQAAYERNTTVFSCVNLIAESGAGVPWLLYERGRSQKGSPARRMMTKRTADKTFMHRGRGRAKAIKALENTEIQEHPLLTLLEKPNGSQAQASYMQQLISYWLIAGNAYEEFVSTSTGENKGKPQEMWNLRPDRVKVIPPSVRNPEEGIRGYQYAVGDAKQFFDPKTVIHRKFFHPTDDWYGLSPLAVAARAWRTDNVAADWNFALIKNQAKPSGALVTPTVTDGDSYERLKKEILENYIGDTNAGLPIFLEGGLKWEQLGLSPVELDWLAGRVDARREICSVFHVPPELIGSPESKTYNSFPEARLSLWMEAIMPILDAVRDAYNLQLAPLFGERLFIDYDRDQIDAIQEENAKIWTRIKDASHLTVNEKREATGYSPYEGDPEEDPVADVPQALVPGPPAPSFGAPLPDGGPANEPEPANEPDANEDGDLDREDDVEEGGLTKAVRDLARELKQQSLSPKQKKALRAIHALMAKFFKEQGADLARHMKAQVEKERG